MMIVGYLSGIRQIENYETPACVTMFVPPRLNMSDVGSKNMRR